MLQNKEKLFEWEPGEIEELNRRHSTPSSLPANPTPTQVQAWYEQVRNMPAPEPTNRQVIEPSIPTARIVRGVALVSALGGGLYVAAVTAIAIGNAVIAFVSANIAAFGGGFMLICLIVLLRAGRSVEGEPGGSGASGGNTITIINNVKIN